MKLYQEKNYYELLEIASDVSPLDIRRAYKEIFDLYRDESIVSYAFFSEKERKEIIARLDKAYLTLINPEFRAAYDRNLIELGVLEEDKQYSDKKKDAIPMYNFKKSYPDAPGWIKQQTELKQRAAQNPVIQKILSQDTITGLDLKKMRTELDVTLTEIAEATNVKMDILQAIEEENQALFPPMVYLKGFLKSYVKYLQIDETVVVRGFVKRIDERK